MPAATHSDAPSLHSAHGKRTRSLKILWTCPYLPWPTVGGNRLRVFHLMRVLAERGHRITFVVQSDQYLGRRATAPVREIVERLIILPRRRRLSPITLAAAALSPYPVDVSIQGYSATARTTMHALLKESWDVVNIEHSYFLQPFLRALQDRKQPFVLTEHNVESTLVWMNDYHPRLPKQVLPYLQHFDTWRYQRWEKRALSLPHRLIAVTAQDALVMQKITGRSVDVVPNGADVESYRQVAPDRGRQQFMYIGNYGYWPNQDAVEWTVNEILPRIWRTLPDTRMIVCGSGMPESWRTRWPDPRIEWRGFIDDIKTVQRTCSVFLAALRAGGGSKLKVLEAMAAGLPVVTTAQGASGLTARAGVEYLYGATPDELAAAVVTLMQDPAAAQTVGEAGRQYVNAAHGWDAVVDQLEAIYVNLPVSTLQAESEIRFRNLA